MNDTFDDVFWGRVARLTVVSTTTFWTIRMWGQKGQRGLIGYDKKVHKKQSVIRSLTFCFVP